MDLGFHQFEALVEQDRNDGKGKAQCRQPDKTDVYAPEGGGALGHVRGVAIGVQYPRRDGAAQAGAGFEAKCRADGRQKSGGANAVFPFAVVHAVGQDREWHRHRHAAGEKAKGPAEHDPRHGQMILFSEINDDLAGNHAEQTQNPDVALRGPPAEEGHQKRGDQRNEIQRKGRGNQVFTVESVFEEIGGDADAGDEGDPKEQAAHKDDEPRPVALERAKAVRQRQRLLFLMDHFLQVAEGEQKQQNRSRGVERQDGHETFPVVTVAEVLHQLQRGQVYEQDAELGAEHPKGGQGDPFARVGGQGRQNGGDRGIDARVKHAAADGSHGGVNDFGGVPQVWREKRQHAEQGERQAQPEKPGPAFAPFAVGLVKDDPPDRRVNRIGDAGEKQDVSGNGHRKPIDIGVEIEQVVRDETKHQLSRRIGRRIAEPLGVGSLVHAALPRMGSFRPLRRYSGIFSSGASAVTVCPPLNFLPVHASVQAAPAGR